MYKFTFDEKTYELTVDNCEELIMDEEYEIEDLKIENILEIISNSENVSFTREYYSDACSNCESNGSSKNKYYEFLGYSFYIFTKNNKYIISNISNDYEANSFGRLYRSGIVDNSFVLNIIFCDKCNKYTIEIEQCDM